MPRPIIHDSAIVMSDAKEQPFGDAPGIGDPIPSDPMTLSERLDMLQRLNTYINEVMENADRIYQDNCHKPGTREVNLDYIARISTHEFFFYTKEPLTLKEFETLQNEIAAEAKKLPAGVQLILGSFAVKTEDNKVMNVVPHITCGHSPEFHFIVKNNTSPLDVRYKISDGKGNTDTLKVFDKVTHPSTNFMPKIKIDGVSRDFTFNNIVSCKTPRGTPFLTAIDICLDHNHGVAIANMEALIKSEPELIAHPISHVVVSNWTYLSQQNYISPSIMHIDPIQSKYGCKPGVLQVPYQFSKFGKHECLKYKLDPQSVEFSYLQQKAAFLKVYNAVAASSLSNPQKLNFNDSDQLIDQYIKANPSPIHAIASQIYTKYSLEEITSNNMELIAKTHLEDYKKSEFKKIYNAVYEADTSSIKPDKHSFNDLSYEQIKQYIKENPSPIYDIVSQIFNKYSMEDMSSNNIKVVAKTHLKDCKTNGFKKIYNALYEAQSSLIKPSKLYFNSMSYDDIEKYIKTNSSPILVKALQICNKYSDLSSNNMDLVAEIHLEAYRNSGLFKKTSIDHNKPADKVRDHFKSYKDKYTQIRNVSANSESAEKIDNSRTAKIFKAFQ